jgi:hypothetical protein
MGHIARNRPLKKEQPRKGQNKRHHAHAPYFDPKGGVGHPSQIVSVDFSLQCHLQDHNQTNGS